jgi:methyl-accepting chemotaxis protein
MSLSRTIGTIVATVLIVTLTAMLGTLLLRSEHTATELAVSGAERTAGIVVDSVKFAMGEGVSDIHPLVEALKKGSIADLRITPTNAIRAGSESGFDEAERAVFASHAPSRASEKFNGIPVVRAITPVLANEKCKQCHEVSVGQPLAIVSVRQSIAETYQQITTQRWLAGFLGLGAVALAFGLLMWLIKKNVVTPLHGAVQQLGRLAEGDLTVGTTSHRRDEFGLLSKAVERMTANLRHIVGDLTDGVQTLVSASTDLSMVSGGLAKGTRVTSERATAVAAAAEEVSTSAVSVADGMTRASDGLSSIVAATEEMSATISDIASSSERARTMSLDAAHEAARITQLMDTLGRAARDVGAVTETIAAISAQTNLLALNATIEAARAGESGKGFAVVATEIKTLARQTAGATEDIRVKIGAIQTSTAAAIENIGHISTVIGDVSEVVGATAAAIDQQATVTKSIAANVAEASSGVSGANSQVGQVAAVTHSIAQDIANVTTAAGEMAEASHHLTSNARGLTSLADRIGESVSQFRM